MPGGFFFGEDGETDQVPQDFAPSAPTGFLDNFRDSYRATHAAGRTDSEDLSFAEAYDPIVDALNAGFRKADGWTLISPDRDKFFHNPFRGQSVNPWARGVGQAMPEEDRIWSEIKRRRQTDPKFLTEIGGTREEFRQIVNARAKAALDSEAATREHGGWTGTLGGFAGTIVGGFTDPVNLGTLALGGGPAKSILHAVGREAVINMGVEAATLPIIAKRRKDIGAPMTIEDAVESIAAAGALGGVFGGASEAFHRGIKRLRGGAKIEDLAEDELLAVIDQGKVTDPDVMAARAVVAENAVIDKLNPFSESPSDVIRHRQQLDAATQQVLDDGFTGSKPLPTVAPSVAERLATFTDPAGRGQAEQIASLTHDIRAALDPQPTATATQANGAAGISRDRLISAVIYQESRGNPNVVSPKGARGSMQVMPETNADPGFGVRPASDGSEAERARVGRDYLDAMMRRYDGNVSMALAAYNAGPGNVDKWIKSIGDPRKKAISEAEWASRIPIKETRDYVPSVLQRAGVVLDDQPMVAIGEQIIDGEVHPIMRPIAEALAEHDADDAFISTLEACLR